MAPHRLRPCRPSARYFLTLGIALVLCGCAGKRQSQRSVATVADSTAVSTVERTGGTASLGLWAASLDADSVHVALPDGATLTAYGVRSSARGAKAEATETAETRTDSATMHSTATEAETVETEATAVYEPPPLGHWWWLLPLAALAAVLIARRRRR